MGHHTGARTQRAAARDTHTPVAAHGKRAARRHVCAASWSPSSHRGVRVRGPGGTCVCGAGRAGAETLVPEAGVSGVQQTHPPSRQRGALSPPSRPHEPHGELSSAAAAARPQLFPRQTGTTPPALTSPGGACPPPCCAACAGSVRSAAAASHSAADPEQQGLQPRGGEGRRARDTAAGEGAAGCAGRPASRVTVAPHPPRAIGSEPDLACQEPKCHVNSAEQLQGLAK